MPGRIVFSQDYRYGFNGKENDNEVKGLGNQQDYGVRIYDPRVGRFLSTDPFSKSYPYLTPYQFAGNKPIIAVDVDGAESAEIIHWLASVATTRQSAQLVITTFHITDQKAKDAVMFYFGLENGGISGFDAIGLVEQYKPYANDAIKKILSARFDTFYQEDHSFENFKKLFPELRMAEDAYKGIKKAIAEAAAGDKYVQGQLTGMIITILFTEGEAGIEEGASALRALGTPEGLEAAEIIDTKVPKQELKTVNQADVNTSTEYKPTDEMIGKKVGHTWEKHGSHNTNELTQEAKNSGRDVGQWTNDAFAEKLIFDNLKNLKNGTITVDIPKGVGRVIHPDGTTSPATKAVIVPSKSGVKTAYPISD